MGRNKGFLGTPFEDAKETTLTGRGLMPWEQKVTDERTGKRKFHGAFTGGFQAGYKNTCGSEIGFTPAQFSSSRSNRRQVSQDVAQFMDDEDAEDISLGSNLVPKEDFQSLRSGPTPTTPSSESVGVRLYRLLSQSQAPSKKPTYGPTMPPPNYSREAPKHKADYAGLGGDIKAEVTLRDPKPKQDNRVKSLFRPTGEIEYDEEEVCGPIIRLPKQQLKTSSSDFPGFKLAAAQPPPRVYPPPTLAKDYNPRPFLMAFHPYKTANPRLMNPSQRQELLEDPVRPPPLFHQFLSAADRERIAKMKPFVKSSEGIIGDREKEVAALPFAEDVKKRERLFRFICLKDGKEVGGIAPMNVRGRQMMTASQLDKEEAEFEAIYSQLKGKSPAPLSATAPQITSTRYTASWQPSESLCRRFNVPEPSVSQPRPAHKHDSFGQEMLPTVKTSESRVEEKVERPLLCEDLSFRDLFKSIFEGDEDEEEQTPGAEIAEIEIKVGAKRGRTT